MDNPVKVRLVPGLPLRAKDYSRSMGVGAGLFSAMPHSSPAPAGGCPWCERHDPIRLDNYPSANCRFCEGRLIAAVNVEDDPIDAASIQHIQAAYRTAILGEAPKPSLFGKANNRQFRRFVQDLLQFLAWGFGPYDDSSGREGQPGLSRQNRLRIVYGLILNSAPCVAPQARRRRAAQGVKLWTALLQTFPGFRGKQIEEASLRWPPAIRRRFAAALRRRIQARWPYEPFAPAQLSLPLKCQLLAPFRLIGRF